MKTALIIFIIFALGMLIYLSVSEELNYHYNKTRKLRTCKKCGNSQRLVNNEWIANKFPCKKCEL